MIKVKLSFWVTFNFKGFRGPYVRPVPSIDHRYLKKKKTKQISAKEHLPKKYYKFLIKL